MKGISKIGNKILTPHCEILWGNHKTQWKFLVERFAHQKLVKLRQTHSDRVRVVSGYSPLFLQLEGDAILTQSKDLTLCVSTADCTPVMFYNPNTEAIGAVHAGWKGVANGVLLKAIEQSRKLKKISSAESTTDLELRQERKKILVWIGPHIQQPSFEVDPSVAKEIFCRIVPIEGIHYSLVSDEATSKQLINLSAVLETELSYFDDIEICSISLEDTKTNTQFCSHRRAPIPPMRQHSWIRFRGTLSQTC